MKSHIGLFIATECINEYWHQKNTKLFSKTLKRTQDRSYIKEELMNLTVEDKQQKREMHFFI